MAASLSTATHLLVISLMLSQQLLPHFLLSFVDIRIELVSVFSDREFLVVIDRYVDFLRADWFLIWVVELRDVRMLKSLCGCESLIWVELQKVLNKVESFIRSSWEHVSELLGLGWWQTLQHCLSERTVDGIDVFLTWPSCNLHDSIKLIQS